jgi:uncharacterized damage-inducible protein DinB
MVKQKPATLFRKRVQYLKLCNFKQQFFKMAKEIQKIIHGFEDTLNGQPWFGRAVFNILGEVDESKANLKPEGAVHSLNELVWHMNTWAEFVLAHLENRSMDEIKTIEEKDWRLIDPGIHGWKEGIESLKSIHHNILKMLAAKDDEFLNEKVRNRDFNVRYMVNGLIDHNIYHLGQIAFLKKMLD